MPLRSFFSLLILLVLVCTGHTVWAKDSGPSDDGSDDDFSVIVCNDLQEKLNIFVPLQETMSRDFARLTDQALCESLGHQCEYFYKTTKTYQKQFHAECDKNYDLGSLKECDYEANNCPKIVEKNPNRVHPKLTAVL